MRNQDIDSIFLADEIRDWFFHNSGLNGAVNDKGHFVFLSDSWNNELGWTITELKEMNFFDLIHPEDFERSLDAYKTNDNYQEDNPKGFINRYRCKSGKYVTIWWKPIDKDIDGYKLFSAEAIRDEEIAELLRLKILEK
jgi:PAS domain S-box-containing protein